MVYIIRVQNPFLLRNIFPNMHLSDIDSFKIDTTALLRVFYI
ncbi:hypothetical protein SAMN05661091_1087 [Paenibacillus uliginis N3/975]|uniref:Uncharacterized protein n=1 Tax=Paenibacillus uliginis N3/975 TaxID=1313296 RepID=A0A1X7GTI3_9BACL|nr:hypothetical protein SAMN05661091_1087 [Paenibacillus uliginis N3/975]